MDPTPTRPVLHRSARFGLFHLDFSSGELLKNGLKVQIQDHSFQVLAMLLERPGEAVTREELRRQLWHSDTFVNFDQGLNTAIMRLRHALEDAADTPRFIETLPRHGYRFIAPVTFSGLPVDAQEQSPDPPPSAEERLQESLPQDCPDPASPQRAPQRWWRVASIFALGLFLVLLFLAAFSRGGFRNLFLRHAPADQLPTLAVLPLDSLSSDPDQDFLAESMTEQLITQLGQTAGLRVLSRGSVMHYAGKHLPLERVAKDLQADAIFEGSITRSAGRLRVTANLYQVVTRKHLWAGTYETEVGDGLSPQREIARDIAQKIQANLTHR